MYYVRPKLPQLGLDLDAASVSGGGSCPAQYRGVTTNGWPFYIRYRGGHLLVAVGDTPETPFAQFTKILDETFGPSLHGDILFEQVCDLTGMTLNGERVPPPSREEAVRNRSLDFSGRTTHLETHGRASEDGARGFVDILLRDLPEARLFEFGVESGQPGSPAIATLTELASAADIKRQAELAIGLHEDLPAAVPHVSTGRHTLVDALEARSRLLVTVRHGDWGHSPPFHSRHVAEIRSIADVPFDLQWADHLRVTCSVATDDEPARAVQREVARLTDEFMPEAIGDVVWLRAPLEHAPVLKTYSVGPMEAALFDWCAGGADRFVHLHREREGGEIVPVGLRVRHR